jgi:DNA-directed RNA polymerase subunit omega
VVNNKFELVLLAAHRSRAISRGAPITIERNNDKNSVIALREIATRSFPAEDLREELLDALGRPLTEIDEREDAPDMFSSPGIPMSEAALAAALAVSAAAQNQRREAAA